MRKMLKISDDLWASLFNHIFSTPAEIFRSKFSHFFSLSLYLKAASSPKGQVEMILELCDTSSEEDLSPKYDKNLNPFEGDHSASTSKHRFSLSDVKLASVRKFMKPKRDNKNANGLFLKVTTSKMRCSIKVKEEFENYGGELEVYANFSCLSPMIYGVGLFCLQKRFI
jgi:hypothetical protein